jgi:WD40 repeat protein
MLEERLDYSNERQRHERFVGRAELLARLDRLLIGDGGDRWVVVTGGPGMGKSALLAEWLLRRQAAGAAVPHHFIRRGEYDWDDPTKLVGSLVAQLEAQFPALRESDADARRHPAARLAAVLARASARELAPHGARLVILIDGLDEYDPPAGAAVGNPLAAFLPHALPEGVSLLCACRPKHRYVQMLEARDGELVRIDLDGPEAAADNEATVRAFWEREAPRLELDARFVREAVACAGGNLQHAVTLRSHLAALPSARRRIEAIPRGLAALLDGAWQRIACEQHVVDGLGLLCAAREALTLDELGVAAGWAGAAERRAFVDGARELLVESWRLDGQAEYRLHHDSIRAYVARAVGALALRGYHAALAGPASWPPAEPAARRYALRHALMHHAEAGQWDAAWRLAADTTFLEAKYRGQGARATELDVVRVATRARTSGDAGVRRGFGDLARTLVRESRWLRAAPRALAGIVWNRLRRLGWSVEELEAQLRLPEASFLRVRHGATCASPALVRSLAGHDDGVLACAVAPDGRRVISGSLDGTLRIWDLEDGRTLATLDGQHGGVSSCAVTPDGRRVIWGSLDGMLRIWDLDQERASDLREGHADLVFGCAVTPDGRRAVSASADRTLKVWDLERRERLAVLAGHADWVRSCAVTADGRRVVSASYDGTLRVWDLEDGRELATLEGHTDWVRSCAVTADGRRAVSGSADGTLRVWDLERGCELAVLEGHACWVLACAVTPDDHYVISGAADETLRVWDLESGRALATLEGHADWVRACAVTADGRRVISASADRTLKVWDLERALAAGEARAGWAGAYAVTADGGRVLAGAADGTLAVWDVEGRRALATLEGRRGDADAGAGAVASVVAGAGVSASAVTACAVTADGRRAVAALADGTLTVWDVEARRVLAILAGHGGGAGAGAGASASAVTACAVTADGRYVVAASLDGALAVWDVEARCACATLTGPCGGASACAVTADGRHVVTASAGGALTIWDVERGYALDTLEGHAGRVNACAVLEDGRRVISASEDRTLKVWDRETRACLYTHRGDAAFTAVAATAAAIAVGDARGAVWILDWPPPDRGLLRSGADANVDPGRRPDIASAVTSRHTILFLAANPSGTDPLALDREARAIQAELERAGCGGGFELVTRWAVEPLDLLRELRRLRPTVVHFSGHGEPAGEHRPGPGPYRSALGEGAAEPSGVARSGLLFHGPGDRAQLVSTGALEAAFGAAGSSVKLVVLSACYSEAQAEVLLSHVDCVVGMGGAIRDDAARSFAIGFYGGLGERESIAAAYEQGRAAISLEGLPDAERPRLKVRAGVDASQLVLAATHITQ